MSFALPASMGLTDILSLAIAAILVNNYILVQFLGCCSFFGVSKKTDTALGMGMAVIFVMAIASAASWAVQYFILEPLGLGYMQTIAFILVIATLVQFVEMFMKKAMPSLYSALGIFLPLITTNCAVLGVTIERLAYKPLRGGSRMSALITTIGVSLMLQNGFLLIFGSSPKPFPNHFTGEGFTLGGVTVSRLTAITLVVTVVLMVLLTLFVNRTRVGKAMRAVSEDQGAAQLMGINIDTSISITFAIGSALAAVAAVVPPATPLLLRTPIMVTSPCLPHVHPLVLP